MKKLLGVFLVGSLMLSATSMAVSCSDPSQPVVIDDTIDLQNYFKSTLNNRMKLRTDYQDIDIAGDKNNVQEVLNSILDDSHVVNTDFIKSLRTFTDKVVEPEDGADYDYRLTYDIVSTGYNKDHPLGAQRLSQASGMENEDFTGTMHDLFYRYVNPDNAETKTDISGMKKKLGKIPFEGDAPTPDEVLKAFNKTNGTNISNKEAEVSDITESDATITKSSNYKGSIAVKFEQGTETKIDIKDVIKIKELGEFDKKPASKDILAAINTANPDAKLKSTDVTIGSIDDVSAKVTGQGDYTGELKVTFTIKDTPTPPDLKKLSEDLTEPNIGTIKDEEEQTILDAVKVANPNVVISELTANSTNDGHADISVKSGSEVYEPDTMQVDYELEKKDIADVISDTPLGELTDNNDDTIVTAINSVNSTNLKLNTDISISDKTETGATITGKESYTGTTTVKYTIKDTTEPVELNTVVNDTELGELADYNSETIKAEVVAQNEGIDETQIEVTGEPTETEATISAVEGSEKYTGSVNVSYTVKEPDPEPTPLEDAIGIKELGDVEAFDKDSILTKVEELNPDLVKDQIEIKEDPTETQATISAIADSTVYSGDAVVTYTYKPADTRQDLKTLIAEPNLGDIQTDDDAAILAAVTAKNPDVTIDPNEVKLVTTADGTNGQSVITANEDSEVYKGTVTVTFTLPDKRTDITTLFDETNVTDIADASAATIWAALQAVNTKLADVNLTTDVTIDDINEEAGTATVNAVEGSDTYKGTEPITFTVKEPDINLTDIFTVNELKELPDAEPQTILDKLNEQNSQSLELEKDVTITTTPNGPLNGTADVEAVEGSGYTGSLPQLPYSLQDNRINISDMVKELGDIENPTPETILAAANEKNKDTWGKELTLDDADVNVGQIADGVGSALITAKTESTEWEGIAEVTFTVPTPPKEKIDLSTLNGAITEPLADETAPTIAGALTALNTLDPALTESDITVSNANGTSATITATEESENYTGSLDVTYTVTPAPKQLIQQRYFNNQVRDASKYSFNEYTMVVVIKNKDWKYGTDSQNQLYIPFTIPFE